MKILDLIPDTKTCRSIISGKQKEVYRDIYHCCCRYLNVDREGYGYFLPACRGDFEDMARDCKDSLKEFTRLLKEAIADGYFEYQHYEAVRLLRGYKSTTMLFKCEGITIGKGNPSWGAPEKEVFIIKLGQRI